VRDQLNKGIRFFDIRCNVEGAGNSRYFQVWHGSVNQQIAFGSVLTAIDAFLKANPTEVVLMRIKKEDDRGSRVLFNSTFWEIYFEKDGWKRIFYTETGSMPTVSQAAGKIVLFSGDIDNLRGMGEFYWQDDYDADLDDKMELIKDHLLKAGNTQSSAFATSLNLKFSGLHDPQYWAGRINPYTRDYFRYHLWLNWHWEIYLPRVGVVFMDFPENTGWKTDDDWGLVPLIINWNFAHKHPPGEYMPKPVVTKCHITAVNDEHLLALTVEGIADPVVKKVAYYVNDEVRFGNPVDVVNGKWRIDLESEGNDYTDFKFKTMELVSLKDGDLGDSDVVNAPSDYQPVEFVSPPSDGTVTRPVGEPITLSGTGVKGSKVVVSIKHRLSLKFETQTVWVDAKTGIWTADFDLARKAGFHDVSTLVIDHRSWPLLRSMSFSVTL